MVRTMQEIIWPANELLASQEEPCYIEIVVLYTSNSRDFMAKCMCYVTVRYLVSVSGRMRQLYLRKRAI